MRFQVERTRHYFERGLPLIDMRAGPAAPRPADVHARGLAVLDQSSGSTTTCSPQTPEVSGARKAWLALRGLRRPGSHASEVR